MLAHSRFALIRFFERITGTAPPRERLAECGVFFVRFDDLFWVFWWSSNCFRHHVRHRRLLRTWFAANQVSKLGVFFEIRAYGCRPCAWVEISAGHKEQPACALFSVGRSRLWMSLAWNGWARHWSTQTGCTTKRVGGFTRTVVDAGSKRTPKAVAGRVHH